MNHFEAISTNLCVVKVMQIKYEISKFQYLPQLKSDFDFHKS